MFYFFAFTESIRNFHPLTNQDFDRIRTMKSIYIRGRRFGLGIIQRLDYFCQHASTPTNWNQHDGIEIHYVLKGSLIWEFEDGSPSITVNGGMMVALPARKSHRVIGGNVSPAVRLGMILRAPSRDCGATALSTTEYKVISNALAHSAGKALFTPNSIRDITTRIHNCMEAFSAEDELSVLRLRHVAAYLLCETATEMMQPHAQGENMHDIKSLVSVISTAPEISLDELISRSGYGRTRFFTLFQSTTGTSPCEYINRERIKKAKRLIRARRHTPLSDIAKLTGFSSPSVFSNVFRRYTGTTPIKFARSK